jgi:hypothetical protein
MSACSLRPSLKPHFAHESFVGEEVLPMEVFASLKKDFHSILNCELFFMRTLCRNLLRIWISLLFSKIYNFRRNLPSLTLPNLNSCLPYAEFEVWSSSRPDEPNLCPITCSLKWPYCKVLPILPFFS